MTNLREQVRFAPVIQGLADAGFRLFAEVTGHPVLTVALEQCAPDAEVCGTLRRGEGGPAGQIRALGEAWARGAGSTGRRGSPIRPGSPNCRPTRSSAAATG